MSFFARLRLTCLYTGFQLVNGGVALSSGLGNPVVRIQIVPSFRRTCMDSIRSAGIMLT
jgi:hypothetical protein